jgi:hypothetical protein
MKLLIMQFSPLSRHFTLSGSKKDYCNINKLIFGHNVLTYKIYEETKTKHICKTIKQRITIEAHKVSYISIRT